MHFVKQLFSFHGQTIPMIGLTPFNKSAFIFYVAYLIISLCTLNKWKDDAKDGGVVFESAFQFLFSSFWNKTPEKLEWQVVAKPEMHGARHHFFYITLSAALWYFTQRINKNSNALLTRKRPQVEWSAMSSTVGFRHHCWTLLWDILWKAPLIYLSAMHLAWFFPSVGLFTSETL